MNSNAPDEIKSAFEEQTEMHRVLLKSMQETITLLRDSLKQKDDTIKSLQQQIANLNKVIFGSRSEKTIYVDPAQKSLFPEDTPENERARRMRTDRNAVEHIAGRKGAYRAFGRDSAEGRAY